MDTLINIIKQNKECTITARGTKVVQHINHAGNPYWTVYNPNNINIPVDHVYSHGYLISSVEPDPTEAIWSAE